MHQTGTQSGPLDVWKVDYTGPGNQYYKASIHKMWQVVKSHNRTCKLACCLPHFVSLSHPEILSNHSSVNPSMLQCIISNTVSVLNIVNISQVLVMLGSILFFILLLGPNKNFACNVLPEAVKSNVDVLENLADAVGIQEQICYRIFGKREHHHILSLWNDLCKVRFRSKGVKGADF